MSWSTLHWQGHWLLIHHILASFFVYLKILFPRVACGIPAPWPGIEPMSPSIGSPELNHWTAGEVLSLSFCITRWNPSALVRWLIFLKPTQAVLYRVIIPYKWQACSKVIFSQFFHWKDGHGLNHSLWEGSYRLPLIWRLNPGSGGSDPRGDQPGHFGREAGRHSHMRMVQQEDTRRWPSTPEFSAWACDKDPGVLDKPSCASVLPWLSSISLKLGLLEIPVCLNPAESQQDKEFVRAWGRLGRWLFGEEEWGQQRELSGGLPKAFGMILAHRASKLMTFLCQDVGRQERWGGGLTWLVLDLFPYSERWHGQLLRMEWGRKGEESLADTGR